MLTNLFYFSMLIDCIKYLKMKSLNSNYWDEFPEITRLEQKFQNTLSLYITSSGRVKAEYQEAWDDLGIKTRSWTMCMSINKDVSHIVVPSESGVQLIVLKTTHDSVIVKTRNLQAPSRYLRLADLHKLITRQLNPSEKIFEFTKILTNFYINPVFQDLFQEIGVIQRVHTRFHSCESETESIESSDE